MAATSSTYFYRSNKATHVAGVLAGGGAFMNTESEKLTREIKGYLRELRNCPAGLWIAQRTYHELVRVFGQHKVDAAVEDALKTGAANT